MDKSSNLRTRRLVLIFWILFAFFYFWLSYDYIRVDRNDRALSDYLRFVVQVAGTEYRPTKEIKSLILLRAEELDLPVQGDQIMIAGDGHALKVAVDYAVDIQIPVFERGIYTKRYQHEVSYQTPR
jgi:hypothetical protein